METSYSRKRKNTVTGTPPLDTANEKDKEEFVSGDTPSPKRRRTTGNSIQPIQILVEDTPKKTPLQNTNRKRILKEEFVSADTPSPKRRRTNSIQPIQILVEDTPKKIPVQNTNMESYSRKRTITDTPPLDTGELEVSSLQQPKRRKKQKATEKDAFVTVRVRQSDYCTLFSRQDNFR
jgi:hypothetical protein